MIRMIWTIRIEFVFLVAAIAYAIVDAVLNGHLA